MTAVQSTPAAHIKIVQHPNPEYRTFHVSRHVCDFNALGFGDSHYSNPFDHKPNELAEKLATALAYIPGVTGGDLKQYEIAIHKGQAFTWSEVTPHVMGQIVAKVFPDCAGGTIEVSTTMDYMVGEYSRSNDLAKREVVKVEFELNNPNPTIDVEGLFSSKPATMAVVETPATRERTERQPRRKGDAAKH